jgi:UDP-2-acetamido-2,6-beta-L-arabino-hexul-4-ose reductase
VRDVALTGAGGFLGWHTRAALLETQTMARAVAVGGSFDLTAAASAVSGVQRVLHIAGVNRGTDDEVRDGNILLANQLASALRAAPTPPATVVMANSIQSTAGGVYGDAKARAADVLRAAALEVGSDFHDLVLPNLFGEHGKPFYNAVTATFSHLIAAGQEPEIAVDRDLTLLHVQDAVDALLAPLPAIDASLERNVTVSALLGQLREIGGLYHGGDIPDVSDPFGRDLFNTYRSYVFPAQAPVRLNRRADARGAFFEIVRSHGGTGQSSFSTTLPGISRGDHFHRRKIERFTVLSGSATISLRRVFTNEIVAFEVNGEEPVAVDMPTMWAHNITNTGSELLYTSFWTNEIFDQEIPDTIAEAV